MRRNYMLAYLLSGAVTLMPCGTHAATVTWDGEAGDGQWTNPLNWSSNALPGPSDIVLFGPGIANTITVNVSSSQTIHTLLTEIGGGLGRHLYLEGDPISLLNVTNNNSAQNNTCIGNTLALRGDATFFSRNVNTALRLDEQVVDNGNAYSVTFYKDGLSKGIIEVNGNNTYGGTTYVRGPISLNHNGAFGTGTVVCLLAATALGGTASSINQQFDLGPHSLNLNAPADLAGGTVGTGSLTFSHYQQPLIQTGDLNHTGGTTLGGAGPVLALDGSLGECDFTFATGGNGHKRLRGSGTINFHIRDAAVEVGGVNDLMTCNWGKEHPATHPASPSVWEWSLLDAKDLTLNLVLPPSLDREKEYVVARCVAETAEAGAGGDGLVHYSATLVSPFGTITGLPKRAEIRYYTNETGRATCENFITLIPPQLPPATVITIY